ncbi:MAG: hypothetical protein WBG54_06255 [Acidobacteriaceae bacterium]
MTHGSAETEMKATALPPLEINGKELKPTIGKVSLICVAVSYEAVRKGSGKSRFQTSLNCFDDLSFVS